MYKEGNYVRIIDTTSPYFNRIGQIRRSSRSVLELILDNGWINDIYLSLDKVTPYVPFKVGDTVRIIPTLEHQNSFNSGHFPIKRVCVVPNMLMYKDRYTKISNIISPYVYKLHNIPYNWSNDLLIPVPKNEFITIF